MTSAPSAVAPSKNVTPATPALSLADAVTSTLPDTEPAAGAVSATVGSTRSAVTVTLTMPTALPMVF